MLDYDSLEDLERYALAADTAERRQLLASSASAGAKAVKPGQAFLAGLFALECGDLAAARDQVQRLKFLAPHSDYCRRLEALVALRSWSEDPAVTCAYLEETCGLDFNAPPPPAAAAVAAVGAAAEGQAAAEAPEASQSSSQSAQQAADVSALDPSLYSDRALLRKAVQMARGPDAAPLGGYTGATALPKLLSRAGMAAALSYEDEYDLGLSLDERLQLAGLGNDDDVRFGGADRVMRVTDLLSGSPLLNKLAGEAAAAERGAAVEAFLPFMTAEQLDELVASLPPGAAASHALLGATVRKMYGSRGAVSGAAAAVDAVDGGAAAATSHSTPLLTAAEATAIRRRVLELCNRLREMGAAEGEVVPERLAWLEARALMPLAEAAVHRAMVADAAAAAAAAIGGGASDAAAAPPPLAAAATTAAEAEELLARLLACLEAQGLPAAGHSDGLLARTPRPGTLAPPSVNLGPALPPLSPNTGVIVRKLLTSLLQVSSNPPALFAPGGAFAGKLSPAVQARLLSEAMLTRGSWSPPAGVAAAAAQSADDDDDDGGAVDWASSYKDTGGHLALLSEAVELDVSGPEGASEGGWEAPGEDVVLLVSHKAVKHISVLVYDIATEAYYRQKGEEVGMGLNLEGLGATFQVDIELPAGLPPLQRCRHLVPLPQLKGRRGVWVVEVQGGGLQSRALLRRGGLAAVVRCSPAGLALTLFREDGSPVANPRVWVDGRVYGPAPPAPGGASGGPPSSSSSSSAAAAAAAAAAREVLVPYRAAEERTVAAVLVDADGGGGGFGGGFASLMSLQHVTEEYDFSCGMHFELESAAAGGRGGTAPLLLQPALSIGGWGASLELLQDVSLTVEVWDFDSVIGGTGGGDGRGGGGGARRQVFQNWNLGDGLQAAVVQVRLPDRPARVTAVLTARLRRMALGSDGQPDYQTFHVERTWELNQSDLQAKETRDLHLTRGSAGNYLLRLLGKAGEPQPGVQVVVALTHVFSAQLEPPMTATESAPTAGGGGGGGDTGGGGGAASGLTIRQALTTGTSGTIDLGNLYGITAVAASVEIVQGPGGGDGGGGGNNVSRRRRYCWPLPSRGGAGTGACADFSGSRGDAVSYQLVRALAAGGAGGDDSGLQCSIPCELGGAESEELQQQLQLRRRLGVSLVSFAAAAAFRSVIVKARGAPAALPAPPPAMPSNPADWDVSERLDEQHVTVRRGQIHVAGLPAGVYGLYVSRMNLVVTILVYGGPTVGPAALTAAPLALPMTAAAAGADAAGGAAAAGAGAAAGGGSFVLYRGLVAPLSEPRPLQITELRASATGGVTARLHGSEEQLGSAVVVLVLTRFEAHSSPAAAWQRRTNVYPLLGSRQPLASRAGVAVGVPAPGSYQSGKRQSDEVRYVLERRRLVAEGRVRPMPALVDRPSLLIQPWKVREAATSCRTARQGEAFTNEREALPMAHIPHMMMRSAAAAGACSAAGYRGEGVSDYLLEEDAAAEVNFGLRGRGCSAPMQEDAGTLGLAFCPPAVVLPNIPVGPDGAVHLTSEQLAAAVAAAVAPTGMRMSATDPWVTAGHRIARLIAYTAPAGIPAGDFGTYAYCEERAAVEGAPAPSWNDPRTTTALQRPFPAGSACLERRTCHALQPGADLVIDDAATAKLQLYGTVQKVWNLYGSFLSLAPYSPDMPRSNGNNGASLWSQFACVGGWSGLSSAAKLERYSQLACRELAFFCYCHDPEFFRRALLPCLRLRLPSSRNCLDCWMAGVRGRELLEVWGAPHRYAKLTPLERILLAWEEDKVDAAAAPASAGAAAAAAGAASSTMTPRLARLAADMRARVRRRAAGLPGGASAVAEVKRQRFEIALNGPGDDESQGGRFNAVAEERPYVSVFAVPAPAPPPPAGFGGANNNGGGPHRDRLLRQTMKSRDTDMAQRAAVYAQAAPTAYRSPPATQEWAEAGWFRRPPSERLDPNRISPESEFWADLAEHLSRGGRLGSASAAGSAASGSGGPTSSVEGPAFLPHNLEAGGWGFSDALLATAVVGVPWEEEAPVSVAQGTRITLTTAAPTVAYVRQTAAVVALAGRPPEEGSTSSASQTQQPAGGGGGHGGHGGLLVIQRLLDPNQDPREVQRQNEPGGDESGCEEVEEYTRDSEGVDVPPGAPLVYGMLYCYSVVASNTSPSSRHVDITVQAPQGAVALGGRPALWVHHVEVPAYGACKLPPYFFYFPRQPDTSGGESGVASDASTMREWYDAFPAAASARGKIITVAAEQGARVQVLAALPAVAPGTTVGLWSWQRLAVLPATPEADAARLKYLEEGDLSCADISQVLWRCKDAAFWRSAIAALRRRRVWSQQLWSYAVLHRDEVALRELLPTFKPLMAVLNIEAPATGWLLNQQGPSTAEMMTTAAAAWMSADRVPHLEYWPLVNPRAHLLGGLRATLNEAMEHSWRNLLGRIAAITAAGQMPSKEDLLAAAYYLILQDQPVQASAIVERLNITATAAGGSTMALDGEQAIQLCYLQAWLVLADPSSSPEDFRSSAATLQQWCSACNADDTPTNSNTLQVANDENAPVGSGVMTRLNNIILEPGWQSRLAAMVSALDDAAIAAAAAAAALTGRPSASAPAVEVNATAGNSCGGSRGQGSSKPDTPELLLYNSPDGPHGAIILEVAGVEKVTIAAHLMDLELLFSASPFDATLTSNGSGCGNAINGNVTAAGGSSKFSVLQPAWTTTIDLQEIRTNASTVCHGLQVMEGTSNILSSGTVYKLSIQPNILVQQPASSGLPDRPIGSSGVMLLEAFITLNGARGGRAATDLLHRSLACYHCEMRVVLKKEWGVVAVTKIQSGAPVAGAYIKAYVLPSDNTSAIFHKDGYTDRRGLMEFWTLTAKPEGKIRSVALLVSHPQLGSLVVHTDPPLH